MARQPNAPARSARSDDGNLVQDAMATAQEAAGRVVSVAETAADRLPAAMASAQSAANDTVQALGVLPDRTLVLGTTFSLGVGTGLFLSGSNRVLVLLALMPALAMAATLVARENRPLLAPGKR